MPNLPTHVELAWLAARDLSDPVLTDHLGAFLLGATAPDARIITGRPRTETHFFDLRTGQPDDGADGLFATHPELKSPESDAQAAFVAGYLTHLVADEAWIASMYRPHFSRGSDGAENRFGSADAGMVYDRAAQLLMDIPCEARVKSLLPALEAVPDGLAAGPLRAETISDWRNWVVDFLAGPRPYRWDRLRHMAGRIGGPDGRHPAHDLAGRFISDVPAGLETLYRQVPKTLIEGYRDMVLARLKHVVGEYMTSSRPATRIEA